MRERFIRALNAHILFGVVASSILSFMQFNHCRLRNGWYSKDAYCKFGYTDIQELFITRGLNQKVFPYESTSNSFEYPPILGIGNWLISCITPSSNSRLWFFVINIVIIVFLFCLTGYFVMKIVPNNSYLFYTSPACIATLYTNWDMWVVFATILSIYNFEREKNQSSAIWLGIAISTKLFPIVLLPLIAVLFLKKNLYLSAFKYVSITVSTCALINLPIIVTHFDGWSRFLRLNQERGVDLGSVYLYLLHLNVRISSLNAISQFLTVCSLVAYYFFLFKTKRELTIAQCTFIPVALLTLFSKVYSPQYILWLTPLAIFAIQSNRMKLLYWFWQMTELVYIIALQVYFLNVETNNYLFIIDYYPLAILFRIVGITIFVFSVMVGTGRKPESINLSINKYSKKLNLN